MTLQSRMVEDVKALFKVLFMFLPLPVFWTLFDQQVRVFLNVFCLLIVVQLNFSTMATYIIAQTEVDIVLYMYIKSVLKLNSVQPSFLALS